MKKHISGTLARLLIFGMLLSVLLSGCGKKKIETFQDYLEYVNRFTGMIAGTDYKIWLRYEGYNLCYSKNLLSELGPMQMDNSVEENQKIKEENQNILQGFIGDFFANDGGTEYYKIKDHDDLQYLISKTPSGELCVWEFIFIKLFYAESSYSYGAALSIYGVNSAKDIKQIVFLPPTFNNTEEGKAIQKEIGTVTVKNAADIKVIYDVLKDMICYGEYSLGRDDLPCYREDTIRKMKNVQMGDMEKYREIRIDLKSGAPISSLKYSATWGGFYEDRGVAYHDLTDEHAALIEKLGKIQKD